MSVVDLKDRLTSDWTTFNHCLKSSDSLIYMEGRILIADDELASMDLAIGERWFSHRDNAFYLIPPEGLHLEPHQATVIETEQLLALPMNVFGLVTGKGRFIFQGMFISAGKIDPCFQGKLKIGFYNGSNHIVVLRSGEVFCSCCFLQMESNLDVPMRVYEAGPTLKISGIPRRQRLGDWWARNWVPVVSVLSAVITIIAALITLYAALNPSLPILQQSK